jgi:4-alpha-glucanotransferase
MLLREASKRSKDWLYTKRNWTNLHGQNRKKQIRVGDKLEDFKERYRALADKHEAMIKFYMSIQYNLTELEKEFLNR